MVAQALHIYKNITSKNAGIELPESSQTKLKQSDSSEVINNDRSIADELLMKMTRRITKSFVRLVYRVALLFN